HQHGHIVASARRPKVDAVDQAIQNMSAVQVAVDELVSHARPRRFLARDDFYAVLFVETHYGRHDDRGTVSKWNETHLNFGLFGRVRSGSPGCRADHWRHH